MAQLGLRLSNKDLANSPNSSLHCSQGLPIPRYLGRPPAPDDSVFCPEAMARLDPCPSPPTTQLGEGQANQHQIRYQYDLGSSSLAQAFKALLCTTFAQILHLAHLNKQQLVQSLLAARAAMPEAHPNLGCTSGMVVHG